MEPILPVLNYQADSELDYRGCLYRYPGRAGQAVRRLKYLRSTSLAAFMSQSLAQVVESEGIEYDVAVPVPIHWFRLTWRGFNQAELLCSDVPKKAQVLRRTRPTRPQAGLTVAERLTNLEDAFEVTVDVAGKRILLVDDVVTSGRTAKECAKALKSAGAVEVGVLAFCGESLSV
jgi:ComF family protein